MSSHHLLQHPGSGLAGRWSRFKADLRQRARRAWEGCLNCLSVVVIILAFLAWLLR